MFSQEHSLLQKLFFVTVVSWLKGNKTNTRIRGSKGNVDALVRVLRATKSFQDELEHGTSIKSVLDKLEQKNSAVCDFEVVFGVRWLL